jgi:hypothetical protein
MFGTRNTRRLGTIAKATIILFVLMTLAAPVFGQVKKATGRVLQNPSDIVTTRKGNFNVGDILGTALVSITVTNDAVPAHLLLKLRIEFGGTWDGDYVQASLVKALGSNASFTFTNRDVLTSLGSIRTNDFQMSDTLIAHTGINGVEDITNLKNIPEGTYSIILSAYEITLSNPADINSTIVTERLLKTERVDFKVVTIGSIGNLSLPTYDNLSLTFQVPEIPVYDDAKGKSTSSTKVDITGPGVTYSSTKNHLKSTAGSSAIKGYPSDTTNGYITNNLSEVPFRAGETYSITIAFNDWNTPPAAIATKTSSVKFPTPKLNFAANVTEPFKPVFSWSFSGTDYSNWVKEYRIYLNGRYIGMTSDDSYQVADALTPNTAYTWYVMPINKDGSNFFASTSGLVQNLTTKAHTEMNVKSEKPVNNSILIKGETYDFNGTATFSDGATSSAAVWTIGTDTFDGTDVSYTPSKRYPGYSLSASLRVTDSLGLAKTSPGINLTVLDPAIKIDGPASFTVFKDTQVSFVLDMAVTRDLNSFEWFVDGKKIGYDTIGGVYKFTEPGTHEVYVQGSTSFRNAPITKTLKSKSVLVSVIGFPPTVRMPSASLTAALGIPLTLSPVIATETGVKRSTWTILGPDTSQNGATGNTLVFNPRTAGEYTATITIVDFHDLEAKASCRILVINPEVTITSPAAGVNLALASTLTPVISAPNASRIVWFLGGEEISTSSFNLSTLRPGSFELYAKAFWNVTDVDGKAIELSKESSKITINVRDMNPPEISIIFPQDGMVFKAGESYTFSARVNSASATTNKWLVDDVALAGSVYTIPAGTAKKLLKIGFSAVNADAIGKTESVSVNVVNPAVYLSAPAAASYKTGSVIPINASAVDAELSWVVDGIEISSWDKVFKQAGTHTVRAKWSVEAVDGSGNEREYSGLSNLVTLSIFSDQAPVINSFIPANTIIREAVGKTVDFSVSATSANTLEGTAWRVIGPGAPTIMPISPTFSHTFTTAGQYTVRAVTSDNQGLSASKEWTVKIINPSIAISYPTNGLAFAQNSVSAPVVTSQDLNSFNLVLDGNIAASNFNWNTVGLGSHTLVAEGFYAVSSQASQQKVSSGSVTFTVENRTPPNFTVQGVKDGDRIIAGLQYNFTVARPNNEAIEWYKNGSLLSGVSGQYSFTPTASDGELSFRVVGKLNNISSEKTFTVRVIDPYINIQLPTTLAMSNLFPAQTPIPLKVDSRDIDKVEWTVDSQAYTNASVSFEPGNHRISVKGFATGVRLPNAAYGAHEAVGEGTTGRDLIIADRITVQRVTASPEAVQYGSPVALNVTIGGSNAVILLKSITYQSNGLLLTAPTRNQSVAIPILPPGRNVIRATATDAFGNVSWAETTVLVYQPLSIGIAQPAKDSSFSPDTSIPVSLSIVSGQYSSISWLVDGAPVANSNFASGTLGRLSPGRHTITANVTDLLGRVAVASVPIDVQSNFQLTLLAPLAGTETIIGNEITCMAEVEKFAGSDFNVSDAAQNIFWYINGSNTGSKGLSYKFTAASAGDQRIQARYEKGDMVRTTAERTLVVRDIAVPVIKQPVNGATIVYSQGSTVALSASGEPGAAFSWQIDGLVVAAGNEANYNPNGSSGQKQLKLVTTAFGRTKEKLTTFTLAVNNPPSLTLTAQPVQYIGDFLSWTASAFDVEDQNSSQAIEIFFDGVKLVNGVRRALRAEDTGQHTLLAKTADSAGVSVTKQMTIKVESNGLSLEMQSPQAGATYYSGFDLRLAASLAAGSVDSTGTGTYRWTVQYLDDPSVPAEDFTGSPVVFRPKGLGETAVTAKYLDANGRERGSSKVSVKVEREALRLGIYWPHGSVVNSGEQLAPRLTGLPETGATGIVTWSLNGAVIPSISSLRAPAISGHYTLTAQYAQNGSTDRAEIGFTVNTPPVVTITNPLSGGQYVSGIPLVLSARVDDDQAFAGNVVWKNQDGLVLGEANPLVIQNASAGEWRISATAADRYGLASTSVIPLRFYMPVSGLTVTVNGGLGSFLVAEGSPSLGAKAEFTGGLAPEAAWTLRQGDRNLVKSGKDISFGLDELSSFLEGPALLSLAVRDNALADEALRNVFKKDYPLVLAKNAIAALTAPTVGDPLWAGSPIPLRVSLMGFTAPAFSVTMNGTPLAATWQSLDGTRLYGAEIPASRVQAEGVYELSVVVTENGTSRVVPATLNVYAQRSGIFVDNAPTELDLETGALSVKATVSGLQGVDGIQWRTDLAASPVGTGASLNLAAIGLAPGNRSITAEALSSGRVISSTTFPLKVYGPVEISVAPNDDPLIVQKGAAISMTAAAKDRDGTSLSGSAITWSSHLDGLLGSGSTLDLGSLAALSLGEHVFTVTATGSSGTSRKALKIVQINVAPPAAPPPPPPPIDETTLPGYTETHPLPPAVLQINSLISGFGSGTPLGGGTPRPGVFGPGRGAPNSSLLGRIILLSGGLIRDSSSNLSDEIGD